MFFERTRFLNITTIAILAFLICGCSGRPKKEKSKQESSKPQANAGNTTIDLPPKMQNASKNQNGTGAGTRQRVTAPSNENASTQKISFAEGEVSIEFPANAKIKKLGASTYEVKAPIWKIGDLSYFVGCDTGGMKNFRARADGNEQVALAKVDEVFRKVEPKLANMKVISKNKFSFNGYPAIEFKIQIKWGGRHPDTFRFVRVYVLENQLLNIVASAKSLKIIESQAVKKVFDSLRVK